jgi:hypothetical protein
MQILSDIAWSATASMLGIGATIGTFFVTHVAVILIILTFKKALNTMFFITYPHRTF